MQRLVREPVVDERPTRRRVRPSPRFVLAGAGALGVVTVVGAFLLPGTDAIDPVAKAALSARDGVFHVVAQTTTTQAGSRPTRVWTETWASADGRRSHSLIYDAIPDGGRGRLVGETVGGGERTSEAVAYTRPRGGGALPSSGEPAAERPHSYVLELLRSGRGSTWAFQSTRVPADPRPPTPGAPS